MLEQITVERTKHIAALARSAREARDWSLTPLAETKLGELKPARGEHNPAGAVGLEPLPPNDADRLALRRALEDLSDEARAELRALTWLGRGDYAAKDWEEAVGRAAIAAETAIEALADEPDLHDLLIKGLYELGGG